MTNTDEQWLARLRDVMPENFMNNISGQFEPVRGILDNMMNMIGRTVIDSVDNPYNPFSDYTKQTMDYGDTIQNYKVKYVKGERYNPEAENVFAQSKKEPIAQYYTYNDKIQYPITIFDDQLKLAFTGQSKFGDFVGAQVDALYESDGLDKYFKWKKFISNIDHFGRRIKIEEDPETAPKDYGEALLWQFKDITTKFRQPNERYNAMNDMAISSGIDIIMRASDKNLIDQKVLAGVYNMEKLNINANFKYVDDFATPQNSEGEVADDSEILAIICDNRAFAYTPRTPIATSIYNPKALATNYFYTVQGIYSMARFRNCVALYREGTGPGPAYHHIRVQSMPSEGGTVIPDRSVAVVGEDFRVVANANAGYVFDHWECAEGEFADYDDPATMFTLRADADAKITAVFRQL